MAIESHLAELEKRHNALEQEIQEALTHPSIDNLQIAELKRKKLHVKDEIARLRQDVLDFDGGDVFAARNDDVLGAVFELDVAVGMHDTEIAGMKPTAGKRRLARLLVLEIAFHHHIAAEHHFTQGLAVARHRSHRLRVEHVKRFEHWI